MSTENLKIIVRVLRLADEAKKRGECPTCGRKVPKIKKVEELKG
jgi:hypothetical protein